MACSDLIYWAQSNMPDLCPVAKLIELGIFTSEQAAYNARKEGYGPSYIKIGRRILYPKTDLLNYLQGHYYECS